MTTTRDRRKDLEALLARWDGDDLVDELIAWIDERYAPLPKDTRWEYVVTGRGGVHIRPVDPYDPKEARRLRDFWRDKMAVPTSRILRRRVGMVGGDWEGFV